LESVENTEITKEFSIFIALATGFATTRKYQEFPGFFNNGSIYPGTFLGLPGTMKSACILPISLLH